MTPYLQTKTSENGEKGNCLATSIGCLLNIHVSEIPAFEEMDQHHWRAALTKWLSSMGLEMINHSNPPSGFAIGVGWRDDGVLHAFIVKDGVFYHDPNPSNSFAKKMRNYWSLVKIENE